MHYYIISRKVSVGKDCCNDDQLSTTKKHTKGAYQKGLPCQLRTQLAQAILAKDYG